MADRTKFRPGFSGNLNLKDGGTAYVGPGGRVDHLDLADGELERLAKLGGFDRAEEEPQPTFADQVLSGLVAAGAWNGVPDPVAAFGTAPEGEEVTNPSLIPVPENAPADEAAPDHERAARTKRG